MPRWLNKQGVVLDNGVVFQRMHRFLYHYMEGDRLMLIAVEPGIYYEEIRLPLPTKWESFYEREDIDENKVEGIRTNIRDALCFMGISFRLVD